MLELGRYAQEEHQKIVDYLATLELDLVLLTGPNYSSCNLPVYFRCYENSTVLSDRLKQMTLSGYLLLIKGSRGMKLETIKPEL
jgi:UDP-N-acetylmuramoyl-tripeptide--D-alanyl-D-alanine ligase